MDKSLLVLLAIAFMAPLVLTASTSSTTCTSANKELLLASNRQLVCFNQVAQNTTFDLLPMKLKVNIFDQVPLPSPLFVCREWMKVVRMCRSFEKKVFREKVRHFKRFFKSKEENDPDVECLDMHFESERERNRVFSKVISSYHAEIIKLAKIKGRQYNNPALVEWLINMSVDRLLKKTFLIEMLPELLSPNPKGHLFNLLSGLGGFRRLPLKAKQFIAAKVVWDDRKYEATDVCKLSQFLTLYHERFEMFKDSLVEINPRVVANACVEIVLGISCARPFSIVDQRGLFGSIRLLFPSDSLIDMACSLSSKLSSNSSISHIVKVKKTVHSSLRHMIFRAIQCSPELKFADMCMTALKEKHFKVSYNVPYHLLFDTAFLRKHELWADAKLELLEMCKPNCLFDKLFDDLTPDLTGLNIQALVKWFDDNPDKKNTLSARNLVALYSLNKSAKAFSKYSQLLKPSHHEKLSIISQVVLGVGYAQFLSSGKKLILLKHLDVDNLGHFLHLCVSGDRKVQIVEIAHLLAGNGGYVELIRRLATSDLSLWLEACLDCPEKCKTVFAANNQQVDLAVRRLIKYIGNDMSKMDNLLKLSHQYQIMVFLLTDCDKVADFLGEHGSFSDDVLEIYYPDTCLSWEEVARAAKRMHKHLSKSLHQ